MNGSTHDIALIRGATAYAIELYQELSGENGAPMLGTQNQIVDFIIADPSLSRAVKEWGELTEIEEATTASPRRLPIDEAYRRIKAFMVSIMEPPVFAS
jgi:hypothetical protein